MRQYHAVTTNKSKPKKQSSLSAYKFFVGSEQVDVPKFKNAIALHIRSSVSRVKMIKEVADYYQSVCRDAVSDIFKTLKKYNSSYNNKEIARINAVHFNLPTEERNYATITLADLGHTYSLDEEHKSVIIDYKASEYTDVKEDKQLVLDHPLRFETMVEVSSKINDKRRQAKNNGYTTHLLAKDQFLPVKETIHLLEHEPANTIVMEGDHLTEAVHVTDLQLKITDNSLKDAEPTIYTLPVNEEQHNRFVFGISLDKNVRSVAFMITTNAADLRKLINPEESEFWNLFTEDVKFNIFCTGNTNVATGDMTVSATTVFTKATDEFKNRVNIEVISYKTDASVYVPGDTKSDEVKEILDNAKVEPVTPEEGALHELL